MLIASLNLHQVKEVITVSQKEINSECRTLAYIGIILTTLELVVVTILHHRKSKICKGHRFSNAVKIMLFISDIQNSIPIKLYKAAGSIHLLKIIGMLKADSIKLNKYYIWDMLEIYWERSQVTFNKNKINLPRVVTIKLQEKIKIR